MADFLKKEEEKVEETPIKGLIEYDASHNFLIGIIYIQNGILNNL